MRGPRKIVLRCLRVRRVGFRTVALRMHRNLSKTLKGAIFDRCCSVAAGLGRRSESSPAGRRFGAGSYGHREHPHRPRGRRENLTPTTRPRYAALRGGDTLVITRLDRLGRSVRHLITLGAVFLPRRIGLKVLEQGIDTATPDGKSCLPRMVSDRCRGAEFRPPGAVNSIDKSVLSSPVTGKSQSD